MKYVRVGNSNLQISRLCFGTLQLGSLLGQIPTIQVVELLAYALEKGITTFDTARPFRTRDILANAFRDNPSVIIIDKSPARTYEEMERDVAESLVELNRDEADIFLLYDVRSREDFTLRDSAWNYLKEAKKMGLVKAIGLSTHTVEAAEIAAELPEVDFVQVTFNLSGAGILDGDREGMERALAKLKAAGKATCAIKPLAGGMLSRDWWRDALEFALNHPLIDCVCVGMTTHEEVDANCAVADAESIESELQSSLTKMQRRLVILDWCNGCEACIPACPTQALYMQGGFARVIQDRCDWCGKCGPVCPEQAIFLIPATTLTKAEGMEESE